MAVAAALLTCRAQAQTLLGVAPVADWTVGSLSGMPYALPVPKPGTLWLWLPGLAAGLAAGRRQGLRRCGI